MFELKCVYCGNKEIIESSDDKEAEDFMIDSDTIGNVFIKCNNCGNRIVI